MATFYADDVSNVPTGAVQGATEPTTTHADWVPEPEVAEVETKVVAAPAKAAPRKQSRASRK